DGVAWSPDGTRLAVARHDGVYAVEANGGSSPQLVALAAAGYGTPLLEWGAWSPDGRYIAFSAPVYPDTSDIAAAVARADGRRGRRRGGGLVPRRRVSGLVARWPVGGLRAQAERARGRGRRWIGGPGRPIGLAPSEVRAHVGHAMTWGSGATRWGSSLIAIV